MLTTDISKAAEDSATKTEDKEKEDDPEREKEKEEAAATKIQAVFRGHNARKSLRVSERTKTDKAPSEPAEEPTKEQLQEEFSADDKELCSAVSKIQATFRGHMSRKEQTAKTAINKVESAAAKIEEKMHDAVQELEGIDLADPDLHKAATKIQASFRGHKVRQEVNLQTADEPRK